METPKAWCLVAPQDAIHKGHHKIHKNTTKSQSQKNRKVREKMTECVATDSRPNRACVCLSADDLQPELKIRPENSFNRKKRTFEWLSK